MSSETRHRTERVYDEEMAPLVAQLIAIAKRENIPLFLSAGMIDSDGGAMVCTTDVGHVGALEALAGVCNRHSICTEVVRGHAGFDTAAGLMITRHHPTEGGER